MARRLSIFKRGFELELANPWNGPLAIPLFAFCVIWDSLLLVWYAYGFTTEGAMPGLYFLMPLLHIAVGVVLTYYALCLLFNKTVVSVNNSHLRVKHLPIPWIRGGETIPSKSVDQIYVEERLDLRGRPYYVLRALLREGRDVELIEIYETAMAIPQIVKEVESFLDIEDRLRLSMSSPKGNGRRRKAQVPRQITTHSFHDQGGLERAQVGHYLMYQAKLFVVAHVTQFDWDNGDSDRLLQLVSSKREPALVYIRQDKGVFQVFRESEVSTKKILQLGFDVLAAPTHLFFEGREYELLSHRSGMAFYPNQNDGVSADQWTYRNETKKEHFRIVNNRGMIVAYLGQAETADAYGQVVAPD